MLSLETDLLVSTRARARLAFKLHQTRSGEVYVLSKEKDKAQVWG